MGINWDSLGQTTQNLTDAFGTIADATGYSAKAKAGAKRDAIYAKAFGGAPSLSQLASGTGGFTGLAMPGTPEAKAQPMSQAGNAPPQAPGGGDISPQEWFQIARDPYATPEERALAAQQLSQRMTPKDPVAERMRQIQLQMAEKGLQSYGQPQYRTLTDPADRAKYGIPATDNSPYQVGSDGKLEKIGGGGVTNNVSLDGNYSTAVGKSLGAGTGDMFVAMGKDGANAKAELAQIGVLRSQLAQTPGGFLGGAQSLANRWGIKLGDNASAVEAADAVIAKLVPSQKAPGSGTISDADLALFRQSLPSLSNTPQGNAIILDTMEALARFKGAQAEIASRVMMQQITPQEGVDMMNKLPDPFEGFKRLAPGQSGFSEPQVGQTIEVPGAKITRTK